MFRSYIFFFFQALPKIFSAGLDVQELTNVDKDEQRFREYWASLQELMLTVYMMRGVSVAAIDVGFCHYCFHIYTCFHEVKSGY